MPYTFDQIFAVDPANPSMVAADAPVTIFTPGDVARTPLPITDTTGVPLANPITTNEHGFGPAFIAGLDRVAWEGGGLSGFLTSYEGLKDEAVAATVAAQSAQQSAADSQAAAETAASLVEAPAGDVIRTVVEGELDTPDSGLSTRLHDTFPTIADLNNYTTLTSLERQGVQKSQRLAGQAAIEYADAAEITESWANLTNADVSGQVQVSGNKLYATGTGTPLTLRWLPVGQKLHAAGSFVYKAGGTGSHAFYAGYEMLAQGAAAAVNTPTGVGIGQQNGVAAGFRGSALPAGIGTPPTGGFAMENLAVYEWSITVDESIMSMSIRKQGDVSKQLGWRVSRAELAAAGFNLNRLFIYVQDSRALTGHYALPYAAVRSMQPVRTKTVANVTVEGASDRDVFTRSATGDDWRIQIPANYDPRRPAPVCLYFHQSLSGNTVDHPYTDSREAHMIKALSDAGFILASAHDGGDRWGNQASQANYMALYEYVRSHYATGPVVFWGVSMGALPALNLIAGRTMPNIAAMAAIGPVADLDSLYANPTYTEAIKAAYGVAGDGSDYEAKTAGFNPIDRSGSAFRGVPMRFYTGPSDAIVPNASNATPFLAKVAPFAPEATNQIRSGGHLDVSQYDGADMVAFFQRYV